MLTGSKRLCLTSLHCVLAEKPPFGWRQVMPLPKDLGALSVNLSTATAEAGPLPDPPAWPASTRTPEPLARRPSSPVGSLPASARDAL